MKTNNEEKETFWIAYADLMAGLLFVFVLLVGGIIVKISCNAPPADAGKPVRRP